MKYIFKPFEFSVGRFAKPKFYFCFNIATYDYCSNSHGFFILLRISIIKQYQLCIIPFGQLITKSNG